MPKNPHANFTPSLDGYTGQGAFKFWCQMALPLTYDDSLSYYELLNKVVKYLNNTISDVSAVEENVGKLNDAYVQLQDYVNNYFDELDIEAELRNVLDAMALDGTLDELLDPLVANRLPGVVEEQIDNVVAGQIDNSVSGQIDEVVSEQLPPLVAETVPENVTDWLNDNVDPVGSAVIVDKTLTIEGAAADAEATGEIKNDIIDSSLIENIDGSDYTWERKLINSDGRVSNSDFAITSEFIDIEDKRSVKYVGVHEEDGDPLYVRVSQYNSSQEFIQRDTILDEYGTINIIVLEEECKYVKFTFGHTAASGNYFYEEDKIYFKGTLGYILNDLFENINNEIESVENNVSNLNADVVNVKNAINYNELTENIDGGELTWERKIINQNGSFSNSQFAITSNAVEINSKRNVNYTGPEILDTKPVYVRASEYDVNGTFIKRTTILDENGVYTPLTADGDCVSVRFTFGHTTSSGKYMYTEDGVNFTAILGLNIPNEIYNLNEKIADLEEGGTYEYYVRNALKKAYQIDGIEWTAMGNVVNKTGASNLVNNGETATGIPYSSAKEFNKYVGINVSFLTFMSATKNAYSLLYTENINGEHSASGYGLTYHGDNCGAYFGDVCSTLIEYALGINEHYTSTDFVKFLVKTGKVKIIEEQSAQGCQICDIVRLTGHVILIIDVVKDETGTVTNIKTLETGATFPYEVNYTADEFNNFLITNPKKTIVRYLEIYKNSQYTPCQFSPVFNEIIPQTYEFNEDVCTFAGDYAAFNSEENVWINGNLGSTNFENIVLVKDGIEISGDTPIVINGNHKNDLGILTAGMYEAYLTGTNLENSSPTHFEVIETNVNANYDSQTGVASVNFTSSNGSPLFAQICELDGTTLGWYSLSEREKIDGEFSFSPIKLHLSEYGSSISGNTDVYLKIFFAGKYGVVCNKIIYLFTA